MHFNPNPSPRPFQNVIVRFQDHLVLGTDPDGQLSARDKSGGPVSLDEFHVIVNQARGRATQSFPRIAEDLRNRGIQSRTGIERYVGVKVPRLSSTELGVLMKKLQGLKYQDKDLVVFAVESKPYIPASPGDPHRKKQGYLKSRREIEAGVFQRGVSAECVWQLELEKEGELVPVQGAGVTVCVCDVMFAGHEDLEPPSRVFPSDLQGNPPGTEYEKRHGNAALGVIAARKDNPTGGTGISPDSTIWFATTNDYDENHGPESADFVERLDTIWDQMEPDGGVVVMEIQTDPVPTINPPGDPKPDKAFAPAEYNPDVRAWIRHVAEHHNILTVLAAGTRAESINLEEIEAYYIASTSPETWVLRAIWNGEVEEDDPNHSWGVIVGGGVPETQEAVPSKTNWGVRVDCQGWGERVYTTGNEAYDGEKYFEFDGSSSATAMVGGVAALLQSAYMAYYSDPLSPTEMRGMLANPSLGRPQPETDPEGMPVAGTNAYTNHIGPLPNLAAMLRKDGIQILADVYIRDHLDDDGSTPYNGPGIFHSPDIIVRETGEGLDENDQAFWDENLMNDLSGDIVVGASNEVFVRLHNRGMNAGTVKVNAYWTEAGTFLDPELWNEIGDEVSASVPGDDHAVVKIPWTGTVPQPGDYCLIATVDSECDLLGIEKPFPSFYDYRNFLRNSNNIAHRNVEVREMGPRETVAMFSFLIRGIPREDDWNRARGFFRLEIGGNLPRGTVVTLRPTRKLRGVRRGRGVRVSDLGDYEVTYPGRLILSGFRLPAGARIPIKLSVRLPETQLWKKLEFHADQYYGDDRLGRVNFVIRRGTVS